MSGFMGSETVVGSHKLFIGSRLNIKYVSEPSDMDSNLLIRNFPGGIGGWRIPYKVNWSFDSKPNYRHILQQNSTIYLHLINY